MKSFATVLVLATSAAAIKVSYDGMSKYDAFAELASQAYGFTQYDMVDTTTGPEVTDSSGYESTGYTGYELDGFNGTEATGSSGTEATDSSGFSPLPTDKEPMDLTGFGGDASGWDWAAFHGTNSTSYGDYNSTSYGDYNSTSHNSTDVDHDWDWDFTYDDDETFGWSGEDGTDDEHHGPWGPWGGDASWGDEYDDGTMGSWGDAYGDGYGIGSWGDAYGDGYGIGSFDDPDAMAAFGGDSYGEFLGQVNAFGY